MKNITKPDLFLILFKAEDIYFTKTELFDVAISGYAPMDFDDELVAGLKGLKWGSFEVVGLEKFATIGPWPKGTPIGLALKDLR